MNYTAILLVTGGVMIGALTFGAIGVNAQASSDSFSMEDRQGYGMNRDDQTRGNRGFIAEILGIDFDELRAQLEDGKTMAEVATAAQGHDDYESFKAEVEEQIRIRLTENGFSQDEINERIERHTERMETGELGGGFEERRGQAEGKGMRDGSGMGRHGMRNLDN